MSYRRGAKLFQAFPRISKLFQGNSKEIPNFSKYFQIFSLAVSRESKGLSVRRAGIAFSPFFAWSRPRRAARRYAAERPRFNIARIPIIGKKSSRQFSGSGLGASAAAHAPKRKPTAATPTPCGFHGLAPDGEGRGGPVERVRRRLRGANFGNSYPVRVNPAVNP